MTALESLREAELFAGLAEEQSRAVLSLARRRAAPSGDVLFRLGETADAVYVLRRGRVELTFPLLVLGETRETRFQALDPGRTLAWSALVPPHRLTMTGRAMTDVELLAFDREALLRLFEAEPRIGYAVMSRLSGVVATRLHELLALWVREVQRHVTSTYR